GGNGPRRMHRGDIRCAAGCSSRAAGCRGGRGRRAVGRRSAAARGGRRADDELWSLAARRVRDRASARGRRMSSDQPDDPALPTVIGLVASSKRYRAVDPAVVRRIASEELRRARNQDDAVKRVKRRLHQAVGAYRPAGGGLDRDLQRLRAAVERGRAADELRAVCRDMLGRHASTRERLPFVDRFYAGIWDAVGGAPGRLLDLGSGLAPLALPWMGLDPAAHYHAIDADAAAIGVVDAFLSMVSQPHLAEVRDLAA